MNGPMIAQMLIFDLFGPGLPALGLVQTFCLIFFEILVKHLLGVVRISTFPTRLHFFEIVKTKLDLEKNPFQPRHRPSLGPLWPSVYMSNVKSRQVV